MAKTIAVSGKGGVGKTTVAGLIVTRMITAGARPILAVDADPNTCLDAVLGLKVEKSVGTVREEAREIAGQGMSSGVAKQELLELKIAESLVEADDFDLIAMGRSEGPGCYCYANNVLKKVIGRIADQYPWMVLDNEAGMENLSRRIVQKVDCLIMVTDPSSLGFDTVRRLHAITGEMGIDSRRFCLVVNRLRREELPAECKELALAIGADPVIGIPYDEELALIAEKGGVLQELPEGNPVVEKIDELLGQCGITG
jgi:CO dehydrogenase maturation factor